MSRHDLLRHFKTLDIGSSLVISTTFVLFALSLMLKGLTHDILLETGVFLVSVKLIIMSHESNIMKKSMETKLDAMHNVLLKNDECKNPDSSQFNNNDGDKWKELT